MAVDPGRGRCGVAVCGPEGILARRVVALADLPGVAREWAAAHGVDLVLVGNQTGSKRVFELLGDLGLPLHRVTERGSTLKARDRYFRDHPPRGWRRVLPLSLQVPPEPYDDYVAVLLAETYLAEGPPRGFGEPSPEASRKP